MATKTIGQPANLLRASNFSHLAKHDPQLLRLGLLAEKYFAEDPNTCLLKLRQLAELLAQLLASRIGLFISADETQYDLLRRLQNQGILPREVAQLFNEVRRAGNTARHALSGNHRTALSTVSKYGPLSLSTLWLASRRPINDFRIIDRMNRTGPTFLRAIAAAGLCLLSACASAPSPQPPDFWRVYEDFFRTAKYVDLTHTLSPGIPVWAGFEKPGFGRALNPRSGQPYTYRADGFEANRYNLTTDQLGTQLDPPAHWDPYFPAIDELPATFTLRPLVVISIVDQVARDPGYHLSVEDIMAWERRHGEIPAGAVVFVRSDWSKSWPDPKLATQTPFPGISLAALKFLHVQRKILFHGHEPLDTDTTPNLEGEAWLLHHGYTQAEGLTNLAQVPETGALIAIGFPKFKGGLGGYARFIAICPPDWPFGASPASVQEAPLPRLDRPLRWDETQGMRIR